MTRPSPPAAPGQSPRLVALSGPLEGESFEIAGEVLAIGRGSANRLQLHHESVSRSHCRIEPTADAVILHDLDSLCGTFVNGAPIRQRTLAHGDFVKVGDSLFLFLCHPEAPEGEGGGRSPGRQIEIKSTVEIPLDEAFYLRPERVTASLEAADRRMRHLAMLLEIGSELPTLAEVEPLVRRLSRRVLGLVPAERVHLLLLDGEELRLVQPARGRPASPESPANDSSISRSLARRVLAERTAVLSNEVVGEGSLAGNESLDGADLSALMCVPLVVSDRPLGVLWVDTSRPGSVFDREHLELLTAVAGIASMAIANAQRSEWLEAENRRFRDTQLEHEIIAESPAMERVFEPLSRVAPTDLTVLVLGESGTGKELLAKALHCNSPRAEQPFVAVNCATLSETLLESDLFGHEKGAFTGAVGRKLGQFELAHRGTLFLDEVGEIPLPLQARLLRALETREIQRVGGSRTIAVDVRVVAATHRDLEAEIRRRTFREDLYHRLNVFSLTLPPLRERREDLSLLANHFAARSARRLQRPLDGLAPETHAAIRAYDWPGNVRELRNAIERAVVLATDGLLRPDDLPAAVLERAATSNSAAQDSVGTVGPYHSAVADAKRRILRQALAEADGNYKEAAERLGLNRTYLHRLITNLDLRSDG